MAKPRRKKTGKKDEVFTEKEVKTAKRDHNGDIAIADKKQKPQKRSESKDDPNNPFDDRLNKPSLRSPRRKNKNDDNSVLLEDEKKSKNKKGDLVKKDEKSNPNAKSKTVEKKSNEKWSAR